MKRRVCVKIFEVDETIVGLLPLSSDSIRSHVSDLIALEFVRGELLEHNL